ncbi:MAG: addiction module protein [Verrucomicrobia bacterium]|nr:addiction module protein [Verrucomicrobiota bacterium]
MSNIELSQFTLREKLQIMESIWEDLRGHVDRFGVPQSHKDILDERRRRIESGKAQILRWDDVKNSIGKR